MSVKQMQSINSATVAWYEGEPLADYWPDTLADWWQDAAHRLGEHPILIDNGMTWSWHSLLERAAAWAATWKQVRPGDRVIIIAANGVGHLLAELATWMRGAIVVPLSIHTDLLSLESLQQSLQPSLIIADQSIALVGACSIEAWQPCETVTDFVPSPRVGDDPALILYTSGSSGLAKGVILSHRNICSQQAAFAQLWPEVGCKDSCVSYLPWHHSFGALAERLWALGRGCCLHVVPHGGHDAELLLQMLREIQPSIFMSVPKLHHLVATSDVLQATHIRWVFTAGAALGAMASEAYKRAGITVIEGWGLTEASPSVTITRFNDPRCENVVGRPIPGVSLGIANTGEILVAGPGVMLGYWDNVQATQDALCMINEKRVLRSGDCGRWSESGLHLEGRLDQECKHPNGEKVPLRKLEQELEKRLIMCCPILHLQIAVDQAAQGLVLLLLVDRVDIDNAHYAAIEHCIGEYNSCCAQPWWRLSSFAQYLFDPSSENSLFTASQKVARKAFAKQWLANPQAWHYKSITAAKNTVVN